MRALEILVALLGSATVVAALTFVFVVVMSSEHSPVTTTAYDAARVVPHYGTSLEDASIAAGVAVLAGAGVLALGLVAWIVLGRDRDFAAEIDALYESVWVRWTGVPLAGAVLGAALYVIAELSFATETHAADFSDLVPFAGGCWVLTLMAYGAWRIVVRLAKAARSLV